MKYMHFNSSCSYAGLANMLALQNYDTEDYKIALEMGLPYFIRYDINSNYYQAGAMLQSKEWFELYLKPRGFRYIEKVYSKDQLITNLRSGMMFGIQATLNSKHAIVFIKEEQGIYSFLNNKWEESSEEEYIYLKASELLEKVPENIAVGYI
ncbi:MAG: hypothetical protein IKM20_07985 [Erysipelotrichales bacterium]|nr:hypothetical protein [Erysipelotrichales bacterium]